MNKCPDCGYQLEPLETECRRCRKYGVPVPPQYIPPPPQPEAVLYRTPRKPADAAISAMLVFLVPALLCAIATIGLPNMWLSPYQVHLSFLIDFNTLTFLPPLITGAALGSYAAAECWEGAWGGIAGMAGTLGWLLLIYLFRGTWNQGHTNDALSIIALLTLAGVLGIAGAAGIARTNRGIERGQISIPEFGIGFLAALLPVVGFGLVPFVKEQGEGLDTATIWGAVFGCCLWGFRILHP